MPGDAGVAARIACACVHTCVHMHAGGGGIASHGIDHIPENNNASSIVTRLLYSYILQLYILVVRACMRCMRMIESLQLYGCEWRHGRGGAVPCDA